MEYTKARRASSNGKTLIIQSERAAFNVDEQPQGGFESISYNQLQMLNANMHIASNEYGKCLVKIDERIPTTVEQLRMLDIFTRCDTVVVRIRDDILAKEVETVLTEVLDPPVLRYMIIKKKTVGGNVG